MHLASTTAMQRGPANPALAAPGKATLASDLRAAHCALIVGVLSSQVAGSHLIARRVGRNDCLALWVLCLSLMQPLKQSIIPGRGKSHMCIQLQVVFLPSPQLLCQSSGLAWPCGLSIVQSDLSYLQEDSCLAAPLFQSPVPAWGESHVSIQLQEVFLASSQLLCQSAPLAWPCCLSILQPGTFCICI